MRPESFKIIPLLILVTLLAFSVRLAEIVTGFSSLSARAEAAAAPEPKKEEPPKTAAATPPAAPAVTPEKKEGAEPAKPAATKAAAAAPAPAAAPAAATPPAPQWADSADSDTEFSEVRHELYDNLAERRAGLDKRESDIGAREALLRA